MFHCSNNFFYLSQETLKGMTDSVQFKTCRGREKKNGISINILAETFFSFLCMLIPKKLFNKAPGTR